MENNHELPPGLNPERQQLHELRHDIRNQLSNMYLAIDQLRYELAKTDDNSFALFCVDTIANSCASINQTLHEIQ